MKVTIQYAVIQECPGYELRVFVTLLSLFVLLTVPVNEVIKEKVDGVNVRLTF